MKGFGISLSALACVMTAANFVAKAHDKPTICLCGIFFICLALVFAGLAYKST